MILRSNSLSIRRAIPSLLLAAGLLLAGAAFDRAAAIDPPAPGRAQRLGLLLRKLDRTARVLYVTAHPDDEDAGLIAKWVHGEGVEVALYTLTRGRGGQNEIGRELFGSLAVLRMAELDAAHRFDGARQMFGRAIDFGYSFSVEETFDRWGAEATELDLVRAIRTFEPDLVVTLEPDGPGGGQHHQASARLAHRAVARAATRDHPDLGPPHSVERIFVTLWGRGRAEHLCEVDLSRYDPLLGTDPAILGLRSREMHKCQGMVRSVEPLEKRRARLELVYDRAADLARLDEPFAGLPERFLDTDEGEETPFGNSLRQMAARVRQEYLPEDPERLVGRLLDLRSIVEAERATRDAPALATITRRTDEALTLAAGLRYEARAERDFIAAGRTLAVEVVAENSGSRPLMAELRIVGPSVPGPGVPGSGVPGSGERVYWSERRSLDVGETLRESIELEVPARVAPSLFVAESPTLSLDRKPTFRLAPIFEYRSTRIEAPPVAVAAQRLIDTFPELRMSAVEVVPDPSLRPARAIVAAPFADGAPTARAEFLVSSLTAGDVTIDFLSEDPAWQPSPRQLTVEVPGSSVEVPVSVEIVGPPAASGRVRVFARARRGSATASSAGFQIVDYPHIDRSALLVPAAVEVASFECASPPPRSVGYIAGTGDPTLAALARLGVTATALDADTLLEGDLAAFDSIIVGVRAYKVRRDLIAAQPRLIEWVRRGGTLVVQYQKLEFNAGSANDSPYAPHPGAKVGRGRVTDETAPVTVHRPNHPLFLHPNAIGESDWQGWVQERGLYFLDLQGESYLDLIAMEDPFPFNAGVRGGALVEAEVGQGRWIYVGLGLFRQLPAGVPGAYRLLANLVAR